MRKPLLSSRSREDHGISKHPFGIFACGEPPCCVIRLLPFTVTASRRHVKNRDAAMNPAIGLTSHESLPLVSFKLHSRTTPRLTVLPKADCRVTWRTSREPNSEQSPPTRSSYVQDSLAGSAHGSDQWWDCTERFARQPPRGDVSPPTAHYA